MNRDAPPRSPRFLFFLGAAALGAVALMAALLAGSGCSSRSPGTGPRDGGVRPGEEEVSVAARLQKDHDLETCKAALQQLNGRPEKLPALAEADRVALQKLLTLDDGEVAAVSRPEFSSLDERHLFGCLLLHDAARSLELRDLPPAEQAKRAFDWVNRQIYIADRPAAPVPPTYALQRGFGSGLDRAYAFLALLQQLGLDGCLIGPPEAKDRRTFEPARRPATNPTRVPFWAVGVRVGDDILLFDPWHGRPLPGPKGRGVATLGQLRSGPELAAEWAKAPDRKAETKPEELAKAEVFLTAPLSALSPRMAALERLLAGEVGVKLAADPKALAERFAKALGGRAPHFWDPDGDPYTYTRVLAVFLPPEMGGLPRLGDPWKFYRDYLRSQVPRRFFPAALDPKDDRRKTDPDEDDNWNQPNSTALTELRGVYTLAFDPSGTVTDAPLPGRARDPMLRGEFNEATNRLIAIRGQTDAIRTRLAADPNLDAEAEKWLRKADELNAALSRARRANDAEAAARAEQAIQAHSNKGNNPAFALLERTIAELHYAEATYLLALCVHEKAERLQARAGRTKKESDLEAARDGWKNAQDWWQNYLRNSPQVRGAFPAREKHARHLAGRAAKLAGAPDGK